MQHINPQATVIVSTYAIIERDGKILLTRDTGKEGWKLPGGALGDDHDILDGLRREVSEETALKITPTGLVHIESYIGERGPRLRFYLTATVEGGELKTQTGEVDAAEWISKKELQKLTNKDFESAGFYSDTYFRAIRNYLAGKVTPVDVIVAREHEQHRK